MTTEREPMIRCYNCNDPATQMFMCGMPVFPGCDLCKTYGFSGFIPESMKHKTVTINGKVYSGQPWQCDRCRDARLETANIHDEQLLCREPIWSDHNMHMLSTARVPCPSCCGQAVSRKALEEATKLYFEDKAKKQAKKRYGTGCSDLNIDANK